MKKMSLNQVLLKYAAKSLSNFKIPQLGNCGYSRLDEDTLSSVLEPTFRTFSSTLNWVARLDREIRRISQGRIWLQMGDVTEYLKDRVTDKSLISESVRDVRKSLLCLEVTDSERSLRFIFAPMHIIAPGFGPFFTDDLKEPVG